MLRKIDLCSCIKAAESWQGQLEKTAVVKVGAYTVSIDRKTTVYRLEADEIMFSKKKGVPRCPW